MTSRKRSALEEENAAASNLYSWEKGINASWEAVKEDEQGNIIPLSSNAERDRIHLLKKARITQSIRRGLIRFLVVAVDLSQSAGEKDYRPSRLEVCKQQLQQFFVQFYDQNPISQLSLMVTRDRLAEKVSDLSGNPKHHIQKLQTLLEVRGLASLQNTLQLASAMLKHIPNYGSREILIVYNSLSSCDPGNIFDTIDVMRSLRIRVHVICLSAELFICKHIAEVTGGMFAVALDQQHLRDLLSQLTVPPADITSATDPALNVTDFIFMGFPKRSFDPYPLFSYDGRRVTLSSSAYVCPRCVTRATEIPTQCCVCNLQLNSSSHIARSFHHLFPVPLFVEYTVHVSGNSGGQRQSFTALLYRHAPPAPPLPQLETENTSQSLVLSLTSQKQNEEVPMTPPPPPPPSSPPASPTTSTSSSPPPPPPPDLSPPRHTSAAKTSAPPPQRSDNRNGRSSEEADEEVADETVELTSPELSRCRGCLTSLLRENKVIFRCLTCSHFFCVDCDVFIHETLHNCPGC